MIFSFYGKIVNNKQKERGVVYTTEYIITCCKWLLRVFSEQKRRRFAMSKIAFLFLTISEINHEALWQHFFEGHEQECTIYVQSKEPFSPTSYFKQYEIAEKTHSTWSSTIYTQMALLKEALKNPENQKFVYLSESTIPLHPFDVVYKKVFRHPFSEFECTPYKPKGSNIRTFPPITLDKVYKNSQWVVLNRSHAELMVQDTAYLPCMADQPHDQEHYPSTFLIGIGLKDEIVQSNLTYVKWPWDGKARSHPHLFCDLQSDPYLDELKEAIEQETYLFARKFSKESDLSPLANFSTFFQVCAH